jgi:hypothetical protein
MREVFKTIGQLAGTNATALITGESGTGKELVARAIYHHGKRSELTFLAMTSQRLLATLREVCGSSLGAVNDGGLKTAPRHSREWCHINVTIFNGLALLISFQNVLWAAYPRRMAWMTAKNGCGGFLLPTTNVPI